MWDFLDILNFNVLLKYEYDIATNRSKKPRKTLYQTYTNDIEKEDYAVTECNNAYYLIWFVYYYVLRLKTYSDTLDIDHQAIFKKYGLLRYVDHLSNERAKLYVGYGEYKYYFTSIKDIDTIIEILYNRYNYKEQLECVARQLKERERQFNLSSKRGPDGYYIKTKKEAINKMIRMYNKWEKAS